MSKTFTSSFWFFAVRAAAVCVIVAASLFLGNIMARAQGVADENDDIIFDDEEFAGDEEAFDAETLDEEASGEDEEAVVEDEGGFFDAIGDAFRAVGRAIGDAASAVGDAVTRALDAVGLGGDEEPSAEEEEAEEGDLPVVVDDEEVMSPEDTNAFALRVAIAARDVAQVLRSARGAEPTRYEPRSFEIPERGLVTLRASQDGPLFCLAFDISEFRVAAALSDALFEVGGVKGVAKPSSAEAPAGKEGINTVCVELPALSASEPLVIEAYLNKRYEIRKNTNIRKDNETKF